MIKAAEYGPYHYLAGMKNADVTGYTFFKLEEQPKDGVTQYFTILENGQMHGLASLKSLPWDEKIFRMKMATIPYLVAQGNYRRKKDIISMLISGIMEDCHTSGIRHVSARIDSRDMPAIHALEENGFKLMDILTYNLLDMDMISHKLVRAPYILREHQKEDIEEIMEVARYGFSDYIDRFHIDPGISHEHSDTLYAEWARNSCLGYADNVFIAQKDSKIIGFITAKIHKDVTPYAKSKLGEIQLGGIFPESRRLGVFTNLVDCCLNWLKGRADMTLAKTSIDNFGVQRVCQKLGFKLAQTQCTFHKSFV